MQVELDIFEARLLQLAVDARIDTVGRHIVAHDYSVHKFPSVVLAADEAYLTELKALWTKLEQAQKS